MRIELDRNKCSRWQASCESCFATRMVQNNFDAADCGLSVVENGEKVMEFTIHDRDGSVKKLTVNPKNFGQAYDSWVDLHRQQIGGA